jgi:tetratricopeptide (TPR) repeat protein
MIIRAPRIIIITVALAATMWVGLPDAAPSRDATTVREKIKLANDLYETGEYDRAVEAYEEVVAWGATDSDLFYNLGNAYYKVGEPGRAVLFYERALRLAPRDDDVRTNLGLVQSLLRDRQFVRDSGVVRTALTWPHRKLNVQELFLVSSALYFALAVILIGFIFRDSGFVSKVYARISMASPGRFLGLDKQQDFILALVSLFVLVAGSSISAVSKYKTVVESKESVVVVEEVAVYGNPSEDSTLQFKIHEGTKVTTTGRRRGWVQVRLPGDLFGWVKESAVESI